MPTGWARYRVLSTVRAVHHSPRAVLAWHGLASRSQIVTLKAHTPYFEYTVTSAEEPTATWSAGGPFQEMRTGTRWTTFTKLPDALSGGRSENDAPVPPERLSTFPSKSRRPSASMRTVARWPGRISVICVSLKFART